METWRKLYQIEPPADINSERAGKTYFAPPVAPVMKMTINCRVIHTLIQSILTAVGNLLKTTYAQEDREATLAKIKDAERKLREMKLNLAADVYAKGVAETLTYLDFPHEY